MAQQYKLADNLLAMAMQESLLVVSVLFYMASESLWILLALITVTGTVTINGLVKLSGFNAHICPSN